MSQKITRGIVTSLIVTGTIILCVTLAWSCAKKSSDDDDPVAPPADPTGTSTATSTSEDVSSLSLTSTYPQGMVMAVVPPTVSSVSHLRLFSGEVSPDKMNMSDKVEASDEKLAPEAATSCFDYALWTANTPGVQEDGTSCYKKDEDLITAKLGRYGKNNNTGTENEPCLVGTAREYIGGVVNMVDRGLGLMLASICQASKNGKSEALPSVAAGELDLTEDLQEAIDGAEGKPSSLTLTVNSAKVTRLEDDGERPVLLTSIEISSAQTGVQSATNTISINVRHSPSATGNATYDGKMWMSFTPSNSSYADVMSIAYSRTGEESAPVLKYTLVRGQYLESYLETVSPFTEAGDLDLNAGVVSWSNFNPQDQQPNGSAGYGRFPLDGDTQQTYQHGHTLAGSDYIAFNVSPLTNEGSFAYFHNFSGNYGENARGFVFKIQDNDGYLKGCAVSGAASSDMTLGTSVRRAQRDSDAVLLPNGYYHPTNNCTNESVQKPLGECQNGPYVYQQCFTQGSDGAYSIDEETTGAATFKIVPAADALIDVTQFSDLSIYLGE